jgi:hypothetical protein
MLGHNSVNFTLEQATKAQMGSTLTLTSAMNGDGRPLYQWEKYPVPTVYMYV